MIVETAVVGCGAMGANHARILSMLPGARLALVVDCDPDRAKHLAAGHGCAWSTDLSDVAGAADAAVLAVPTEAHLGLGVALLEMGVHLLVEKPVAATVPEADDLIAAADRAGKLLGVGHVERFNPVCLDLPLFVDKPLFIQTQRLSPYTARISEGVIRDLMIHDVDLVLSLAGSEPVAVHAEATNVRSDSEDVATATIRFASGLVAQLTVSRIAQHKVRRLDVVQEDSVVEVDLLRQDITVRRQASVEYFDDGARQLRETSIVEVPYLSHRGEPLWLELERFVAAVSGQGELVVDGRAGRAALELCDRILAAAKQA